MPLNSRKTKANLKKKDLWNKEKETIFDLLFNLTVNCLVFGRK